MSIRQAPCLFVFPDMSTGGGCEDPSIVITSHTSLPQFFVSAELAGAEAVEAGGPGAPPRQPHSLPGPTVARFQSPGATVARDSSDQQRLHAESPHVQSSLNISLRLHRLTLWAPFGRVWLRLAARRLFVNIFL